jgi:hypothetical protein
MEFGDLAARHRYVMYRTEVVMFQVLRDGGTPWLLITCQWPKRAGRYGLAAVIP